jgi:non-ribosomal peptide synthetase component F
VTVAGRPAELPASDTMIGMFINTLPVRVPIPASAAALDWLRQLQEQQAELRQYEYSPLVQVQGWSAAPRGVPLFESILVFENYPVDEAVAAQNSRRSLAIRDVRAVDRNTYPLTLGVGPGPELALTVVYDSRRFEGGAIERMLGHYQQLLEGLAADPDRTIADLTLLTEAEQARVLHEWSTPDTAPAAPQPIHELLGAVAARTPEAPALRCGAQALTYAALDARANQLAHHLQSFGVGPDTLVALGLPRSIDLIVALLATLKAGGAFLPLDLATPTARLAALIADSGAALLVTLDELGGELPTGWLPLVCLDTDADQIAALPDTAPATATQIEHLAYVIYTSGSTGVPKGVAVAHRGLATLLAAQAEAFPVTPESRVLQFASPAFDAAIAEILVTLGAGATLVLAEGGAPPVGGALLNLPRP